MEFNDEVMVVLATSPTGLGHIRVMEALKEGIPAGVPIVEVGVDDPKLQILHRVGSVHPWARGLVEAVQDNQILEEWFSRSYRNWLRRSAQSLEERLVELVREKGGQGKTVVVLATHCILMHQLAGVKKQVAKRLGTKVVTAMVVTDDSPQRLWGVEGIEVIFVPSESTKAKLSEYLATFAKDLPEVVVVPYPVSLKLGRGLGDEEWRMRKRQYKPDNRERLVVTVPISGAAVQLNYFRELILGLRKRLTVKILVVSREAKYTHGFLSWCRKQAEVEVVASREDARVVADYIKVYEREVVGVEVTKPSEQAFKALYKPLQRGGSILLFSEPVGRQERDNLSFLRRHQLLPEIKDQEVLDKLVKTGRLELVESEMLERAKKWRGLLLPQTGRQAARMMVLFLKSGLFAAMGEFEGYMRGHEELDDDGVKIVWEKVGRRV